MNRRSFFKSLAVGVAAASCGQILIPKLPDAYRWKRTAQCIIVPNPDYITAPMEMVMIHAYTDTRGLKIIERRLMEKWDLTPLIYPLRFTVNGEHVPQFISQWKK